MKFYNKLFLSILFFTGINSFISAQQVNTKSAGEISFKDDLLNPGFNKVYLLQPGEHVVISNLCSSEEIAIGLKNYFDLSNKLAIEYQERDSLSIKLINEYAKMDETITKIHLGLRNISASLKKVNLQDPITLLGKSNETLENSNKQLDNAVVKLNEINSDLNGLQFANLWSILAAGIIGFIAGALIF